MQIEQGQIIMQLYNSKFLKIIFRTFPGRTERTGRWYDTLRFVYYGTKTPDKSNLPFEARFWKSLSDPCSGTLEKFSGTKFSVF